MTTPITGEDLTKKQEQFANQEFYGDQGDQLSFKLTTTGDKEISGKIISTNDDQSFTINLAQVTDTELKKELAPPKPGMFSSIFTFGKPKETANIQESRFILPNEFKELISYTPAASSGGKRKSKRKHRKSRKSKKSRRKPRKSKKSKKSRKH